MLSKESINTDKVKCKIYNQAKLTVREFDCNHKIHEKCDFDSSTSVGIQEWLLLEFTLCYELVFWDANQKSNNKEINIITHSRVK